MLGGGSGKGGKGGESPVFFLGAETVKKTFSGRELAKGKPKGGGPTGKKEEQKDPQSGGGGGVR